MILDPQPAVQRRRVRTVLREAREKRGLTQQDVAKALDISPTKVIRIESGAVGVATTDLRAMLRLYGIDDEHQVQKLTAMARVGRAQPLEEFHDVLLPDYQRYLAYEAVARAVRNFQPELMPGVLQTREYTYASIRALSPKDTDEATVQRLVQARTTRQEMLSRPDAPSMTFILDETVIRRRVGSPEATARQLEHLKTIAHRPNIDIGVIPFEAGLHPGMAGSFVILEFDDPLDEGVVYLEDLRGEITARERHKDLTFYQQMYAELESLALFGDPLTKLIDNTLSQLSHTGNPGVRLR